MILKEESCFGRIENFLGEVRTLWRCERRFWRNIFQLSEATRGNYASARNIQYVKKEAFSSDHYFAREGSKEKMGELEEALKVQRHIHLDMRENAA